MLVTALLLGGAGAGRPVAATRLARAAADLARPCTPALSTAAGIAAARRWAAARKGEVAFAVLDERGRIRGLQRTRTFPSASVVKAMLMVAVLRRAGARPLPPGVRARLAAMVRASDNDAARGFYRRLGPSALLAVARVARMRRFSVPWLFDAQITAADQVRLFLRIDALVPRRHRAAARRWLATIVPEQRWGIAPVAQRRGAHVLFKGGWREGLDHQVALLERGPCRLALAVLTTGSPSAAYRRATIAGVAARVIAAP